MSESVLCYLEKNDMYLMLYRNKKKNDINSLKWIGLGGKIEEGETPEEALIREIKEESGLNLVNYEKRGIVHFKDTNYTETMHLYTSNDFEGVIKECDEGTLSWIPKEEVLNLKIWEGDKVFLKLLINNSPYFEINLEYDNGVFLKDKDFESNIINENRFIKPAGKFMKRENKLMQPKTRLLVSNNKTVREPGPAVPSKDAGIGLKNKQDTKQL